MKLNVGWKLYAGFGVTLLILAIVSLVAVIVTGAIAVFLSRSGGGGVGQVAAGLKAISVGNLGVKVEIKSKDELGEMASAYQDMRGYLGAMSKAAEHIADGSLTDEVKPKSDDDVLGNALVETTNNLNDVLMQVRESAGALTESRSSYAKRRCKCQGRAGRVPRSILPRARAQKPS